MLYDMCHVMLYNMCHVKLCYITTYVMTSKLYFISMSYVMLHNMCPAMLYNICHVI